MAVEPMRSSRMKRGYAAATSGKSTVIAQTMPHSINRASAAPVWTRPSRLIVILSYFLVGVLNFFNNFGLFFSELVYAFTVKKFVTTNYLLETVNDLISGDCLFIRVCERINDVRISG